MPILSKENDPMGRAIFDYYHKNITEEDIIVFSSVSDEEETIPVKYLFRRGESMPLLEYKALELCSGKILDVGSGSGCHSLELQKMGKDVTALELSEYACDIMSEQGLKDVINQDFFELSHTGFDSLLFLMNGIGIVGKLKSLPDFFLKCKQLLNKGGKVILDSSDLIYLFTDEDGNLELEMNWDEQYYGEVIYEMKYKDVKSEPFSWLFVDYVTLKTEAEKHGFSCNILIEDDHYAYLACLELI